MDRKLLLAILKHHTVAVDSAAVAQELSTDDQPCTAMAIQKRLQKIRDMMKKGYYEPLVYIKYPSLADPCI